MKDDLKDHIKEKTLEDDETSSTVIKKKILWNFFKGNYEIKNLKNCRILDCNENCFLLIIENKTFYFYINLNK
jgi:hypothetical protein